MALSAAARRRLRQWLEADLDENTRREIQQLVESGDENELEDRFGREMEFGTGGLRGIMAAGSNRMNIYTVARATQGLANYIKKHKRRDRRAVIAYDSRHNSRKFAETTAEVLAANGIAVRLFRQLRPTPLLSFAVRHFGATAGVVITSSHNPKEYNGYKVYWEDGGQIVPPHDKGIIAEVKRVKSFDQVRRMDLKKALARGRVKIVGAEVDHAYLEAIRPLSLHRRLIRKFADDFKIVYTPLHGTGATMVPKALRSWGFRKIEVVPSQAEPNGDFPTVRLPNPEDPAAFKEALKIARETDADLVMASDPDCDRLGVAVRVGPRRYRLLTGNQLGAIMADYLCRELIGFDQMPENPLIVTTIVTTDLIEAVGDFYGVPVEETLTGFKWICEKIRLNEEYRASGRAWHTFIFGTEESYGYLVGTVARDKDAIIAACTCAEMAVHARSEGKTLLALLDEIEMRHGAFLESLESIYYEGVEGAEKISRIMESLRNDPPRRIGGLDVEVIGDVKRGRWLVGPAGAKAALPNREGRIDLPRSNVLIFNLAGGSKVIARPSGTEPKIKFYFNLCLKEEVPFSSRARLFRARRELADLMRRVKADFLADIARRAGR